MTLAWIIAADSTHARIFTAETPSSSLQEIENFAHTESRLHDREITADLPGKIKSAGAGGHTFEQPTDPKQHEAENFAHFLAGYLENAHLHNKFGRLLIIAEPKFLGLLRRELPDTLKHLVSFELDKNITMHSIEDIRKHLPDFLPGL